MVRYLAGVVSALLLASAGVLIWTGRAQKDDGAVPPAPKSAQAAADQDDDAELPGASEKSREQRRFARYDGNEDGIITRVEMLETRRKPFQKLDVNGDGQLTFEEWAVATAEKFGKADGDKSGTLNAGEFATTKRESKVRPKCEC